MGWLHEPWWANIYLQFLWRQNVEYGMQQQTLKVCSTYILTVLQEWTGQNSQGETSSGTSFRSSQSRP